MRTAIHTIITALLVLGACVLSGLLAARFTAPHAATLEQRLVSLQAQLAQQRGAIEVLAEDNLRLLCRFRVEPVHGRCATPEPD